MRYIDADNLIDNIKLAGLPVISRSVLTECLIPNQPTADVRENVRAEIVHAGGEGVTQWFKCSECGTPVDITDNFCRCCGSDMRGES